MPIWLEQGTRDSHLVDLHHGTLAPPTPKQVASCVIDRDHARVLRSRLRRTIDDLDDGADLSFAFDGRVLTITVGCHIHEALASGEPWPREYRMKLAAGMMPMPARFAGYEVRVVVYERFLMFGSRALNLREPSP